MWRRRATVLGVCLCVWVGVAGCSRSYRIHTVRPGETLSGIGQAYGVPYRELARLNDIRDPNRIRAGQRLRLPSGASSRRGRRPARRARPQRTRPAAPVKAERIFSWPLCGRLTSGFGPRKRNFHDGIDLAAPVGTPVRAAGDGRVAFSGTLRGYGKVVILKHANEFHTVYAHHRRNRVKTGARVRRGDVVGEVGVTGRVTGPSLHFEVRKGRAARDPIPYLAAKCRTTKRK